jgi:hypothetical protein
LLPSTRIQTANASAASSTDEASEASIVIIAEIEASVQRSLILLAQAGILRGGRKRKNEAVEQIDEDDEGINLLHSFVRSSFSLLLFKCMLAPKGLVGLILMILVGSLRSRHLQTQFNSLRSQQ